MTYTVPPFTTADTLELEDAAELMRLSHRRLVEARAGVQAWRVAGAVWGLTVPYRKGWEAVYVERLERLTGMDNRAVRRGIKECATAGAVEWEPNRWIPPKGQAGRPSLIGLPCAPKAGSNQPGLSSRPARTNPALETSKAGSNQPDSITNDSCQNYIAVKGSGHDHYPFEALTTDELRRGAREYGPTIAALYRDELERREP
jgi:hypothetical protein